MISKLSHHLLTWTRFPGNQQRLRLEQAEGEMVEGSKKEKEQRERFIITRRWPGALSRKNPKRNRQTETTE